MAGYPGTVIVRGLFHTSFATLQVCQIELGNAGDPFVFQCSNSSTRIFYFEDHIGVSGVLVSKEGVHVFNIDTAFRKNLEEKKQALMQTQEPQGTDIQVMVKKPV